MRRVLVVIDVLNGFLDDEANLYCGTQGRAIIPFVREKIKERVEAGDPVIFLCDAHAPDDKEFKLWPRHCVRGTREAEIIDELKPLAAGQTVLRKTTYKDFIRPEVEDVLRRLKPEVVELVGVYTNVCVLFAAEELRALGCPVRVYAQGVASSDKVAHRLALGQMKKMRGVEVVP